MRRAVVWSIERRSDLAWSVQAISLPIVTGRSHAVQAEYGPCARNPLSRGRTRPGPLRSRWLVVLEPSLGSGYCTSLSFADRLILVGRIGDAAGHRIEHDLQQTDDSRDLTRSQA